MVGEMFTEPNDPTNTVRNCVPKANFNITISSPKRHFLCFAQNFLLYSEWVLFDRASSP